MKKSKLDQEFETQVLRLSKSGFEILKSLTPQKLELWHAVTGISSEAGELLGAIKKHVIYNQELDTPNVIEELGYLEFYIALLRLCLGLPRSKILEENIKKLSVRCSVGYNNEAAKLREDKNEPQNVEG